MSGGAARASAGVTARRHSRGRPARRRVEEVVVEEPLEIRLGGKPVAVVMRTPGDELALAVGFLLTEGILSSPADLGAAAFCADAPRHERNVVDVTPARGARIDRLRLSARTFVATSSCGVCGKASLDAVFVRARPVREKARVGEAVLARLPARLRERQKVFSRTGGLHAAGLFSLDGRLLDLREDIGRHNAVDKLVGAAILEGRFPLAGTILLVSGRASFEIAQKALVARVPIVASVSAPSSLAIGLAREAGMTLVGFLRGATMNVYAGAGRLAPPIRTSRPRRR